MEAIDYVNIPRERIAVLIGKKGEIRKKIEEKTGVEIEIDSESGEVSVNRGKAEDQLAALKALDVIKAIGRGFSPQKAFKLLSDNIYIEIIDLTEFYSPRALSRVKARIIGRQGKARKYISKLTSTDIVIYGKTVSIIGDASEVNLAKDAVLKIIRGLPHNIVFRSLERKRREKNE